MDAANSATVVTADVLGHPTDFLIEQKRDGDEITITVSTVFPAVRWDGSILLTWPAPRYPWTHS
jgi:hypothetical protein